MKKILLIAALMLSTLPLFAQDNGNMETLFGNGSLKSGGYGGPVVRFTSIMNEFAVLAGGRGGWIINSTFSIGGGAFGLVTSHDVYTIRDTAYYLRMGYGGLFLEYINSSDKLIHFTLNALIGGGGASNSYSFKDMINKSDNDNDNDHDIIDDASGFFVFEPGVTVDVNLFSFMRLGLGASYRLVSGLELKGVTNKDISGPSGSITLKFGKF